MKFRLVIDVDGHAVPEDRDAETVAMLRRVANSIEDFGLEAHGDAGRLGKSYCEVRSILSTNGNTVGSYQYTGRR